MQVNAASENTSRVILNEDAWKSKLTTKKYSSKRWVKFREFQTEKKKPGEKFGEMWRRKWVEMRARRNC